MGRSIGKMAAVQHPHSRDFVFSRINGAKVGEAGLLTKLVFVKR